MRTEFSKQTKRSALERSEDRCEGIQPSGERCGFPVDHKKHFDHVIPDALGGTNELSNCAVLCIACHGEKTRKIDIPLIAKAKRISDKHSGIRAARAKIQSPGFQRRPPQRSASREVRRKSEMFIGGETALETPNFKG